MRSSDIFYSKASWSYIAAAVGLSIVFYIAAGKYSSYQEKKPQAVCLKDFPFTNRTLGCRTFDENSDRIHALEAKLDKASEVFVQNGKAKRVSIFVRDLVSQQWAGSNENEVYAPASLMKLPLVMAYFKISELDPSILSQSIVYQDHAKQDATAIQDFVPADPIVSGRTYTVQQLIEHMIENSDNAAADLLYAHINPDIFNQTAIDLGIKIPSKTSEIDFVTAKTYAGIIRTLYNSSYLNRASSEKVLSLMSKTAFKGIDAPIPADVVVSHKFGERQLDAADGTTVFRELHDCGVVYKDPNPYIICIMTEGKDFNDLVSVLSGLSNLVYENM